MSSPRDIDCIDIFVLRGMVEYVSTLRLVRELGVGFLATPAIRAVAQSLIDGRFEPPDSPVPLDPAVREVTHAVLRCAVVDDEAWCDRLVHLLVENRKRELLAAEFKEAARVMHDGVTPVCYVRQRVMHAFRIARGRIPPDTPFPWPEPA